MEYNKEEARRAMNIAERKVSETDYLGAKKFISKAQNLYPNLDGLKQALMMIDVYISGGESDWYGILGVDPLADVETVKKQYKKLALLLHPDKNKLEGAEGAFKLVAHAWCLLSDKVKRSAYDQKRNWKQVNQKKSGMQQKPQKQYEPEKPQNPQKPYEPEKPQNPQKPHEPVYSYESAMYAEEARTNWNIWLEESRKKFAAAVARGNKNEAERLSKKRMRKKRTKNSTFEAERLFKKPMASG